jgi:hypothetical protein
VFRWLDRILQKIHKSILIVNLLIWNGFLSNEEFSIWEGGNAGIPLIEDCQDIFDQNNLGRFRVLSSLTLDLQGATYLEKFIEEF